MNSNCKLERDLLTWQELVFNRRIVFGHCMSKHAEPELSAEYGWGEGMSKHSLVHRDKGTEGHERERITDNRKPQ